jgi:hypothetical protein
MSKYTTIIPLGESCNISGLMQNANLKKETSLFEWFETTTLNKITDVINKIVSNNDINIYHSNNQYNDIYIDNETMRSHHYTVEQYKDIFNRRSQRFLNTIKTNNKILFIRFEDLYPTNYTFEDIDKFVESIKKINPNIDEMKLLLIGPGKLSFIHPFIIEKQYNNTESGWGG